MVPCNEEAVAVPGQPQQLPQGLASQQGEAVKAKERSRESHVRSSPRSEPRVEDLGLYSVIES